MTKRVHFKFNCITVNFDKTQLGIYLIHNFNMKEFLWGVLSLLTTIAPSILCHCNIGIIAILKHIGRA